MSVPFEEWRPVRGYEGLYEVSSLGYVKTKRRKGSSGGLLVMNLHRRKFNSDLYRVVTLCKNGVRKSISVHVLVCQAFHKKSAATDEVRHLDSDSLNNTADNLRWGSRSENLLDRWDLVRNPRW